MMVEFVSLKLTQSTVEERPALPQVGDRVADLRRWPGKVFEVVSVDDQVRPQPTVMVREISDR
jgi:hypothetical protein